MRPARTLLLFFAVVSAPACSPQPSEETLENTVRDYFRGRNYTVAELRIGEVTALPLHEKTYMGTPGFMVSIEAITLEANADTTLHRKGDRVSFSNASIRVRELPGRKGEWGIAEISGIPVP